jgi:nucleotidyltransferase substrate binding protein (TIGR01987 family)
MTADRMQERITAYLKAFRRLEDAARRPKDEFMRDSVIQRFEFTYELAWNMLKERLDLEGIAVRTPRETWQQALLAGMIVDGNRWSDMQKLRNLTSHTYDEALADQVYGVITSEGLELFRQLAEKGGTWQTNP